MVKYEVKYRSQPFKKVASGSYADGALPADYAGKVTAVKPWGTWPNVGRGQPFSIVQLDVTEEQASLLAACKLKITETGPDTVSIDPVTWDDKWGAIAPDIPDAIRQALEQEETATVQEQEDKQGLFEAANGYVASLRGELAVGKRAL